MTRTGLAFLSTTLLSLGAPTVAFAQSETTLITPTVPEGYDRGRNVSVVDRARPDYDPLGVRLGGFVAYPAVTLGLGATSNVFLTDRDTKGDVYGTIAPSIRLTSDWSRHQLTLLGGGLFEHYFSQKLRDQNAWYTSALGRLDVNSDISVSADGGIKKTYESPFSGEVDSTQAVLSSYYQTSGSVKGVYVNGRGRFIATYNHDDLDFRRLRQTTGPTISQAYRDRNVDRISGQVEHALSPEISAYAQVEYSDTDYRHPLQDGSENKPSTAYRVLARINFDLTSLVRGSVGVGYTERDYKSSAFTDVTGLSIDGKVEYFPTELTTFTLELARSIEDSSLSGSSAYLDNRISLRADHEVLKNLTVNATAEFSRQDYFGSRRKSDVYEVTVGADYLVSRTVGLGLTLAYRDREVKRTGSGIGSGFNEFQGQISLTVQR